MGKQDKRVDAYIAKSADFAKPILKSSKGTSPSGLSGCRRIN